MTLRLSELAHGRDNNFQLIRLAVGRGRRAVPQLRADRPLDRRAAVARHARTQLRRAGRRVLFRDFRLPGDAELARAHGGRAVRRRARAAHLSGAGRRRRCSRSCSRARRARSTGRDFSRIRRRSTTSCTSRPAGKWSTDCPAHFPRIRIPHDVNGSLWTLPSNCGCMSPCWSPASLGLAGAARRLARCAVARARAVRVAPRLVSAAAVRQRRRAISRCCSRWARSPMCGATRIPVSLAVAAVALLLVIVESGGLARGALFAPLLAYVVLVVAYHPRLHGPRSTASATIRMASTSIRFRSSRR